MLPSAAVCCCLLLSAAVCSQFSILKQNVVGAYASISGGRSQFLYKFRPVQLFVMQFLIHRIYLRSAHAEESQKFCPWTRRNRLCTDSSQVLMRGIVFSPLACFVRILSPCRCVFYPLDASKKCCSIRFCVCKRQVHQLKSSTMLLMA